MDVGDVGNVRRRPFAFVDVDEEIPRDPEGEEVDRGPADDLVRAEVDGEEGVDEREDEEGDDEQERDRLREAAGGAGASTVRQFQEQARTRWGTRSASRTT